MDVTPRRRVRLLQEPNRDVHTQREAALISRIPAGRADRENTQATAAMMYRLRQLGNVGSWMSLTNGFQSPNGITAMFIATEQDVANVAESSAAVAARRAGARFSITARSSPAVSTAIASIRDDAWTPIHYPNAVWDEAEQRLISDAEIAEVPFTAFTSRRTAEHISGRLIVRRVKRLNPTAKTATSAAGGDRQGEL